ncbi:hypothetical protein RND71_036809 [Anisodus tanguticus]|uniref:Uncharacterized protein n=1 Tax=Anisodus tanguticus TaxID=243964 RepID=A0AAE1R1P5_9SOLA|nr:hypothetical protein RND71_036809 [Anisodus tanguticus]
MHRLNRMYIHIIYYRIKLWRLCVSLSRTRIKTCSNTFVVKRGFQEDIPHIVDVDPTPQVAPDISLIVGFSACLVEGGGEVDGQELNGGSDDCQEKPIEPISPKSTHPVTLKITKPFTFSTLGQSQHGNIQNLDQTQSNAQNFDQTHGNSVEAPKMIHNISLKKIKDLKKKHELLNAQKQAESDSQDILHPLPLQSYMPDQSAQLEV